MLCSEYRTDPRACYTGVEQEMTVMAEVYKQKADMRYTTTRKAEYELFAEIRGIQLEFYPFMQNGRTIDGKKFRWTVKEFGDLFTATAGRVNAVYVVYTNKFGDRREVLVYTPSPYPSHQQETARTHLLRED